MRYTQAHYVVVDRRIRLEDLGPVVDIDTELDFPLFRSDPLTKRGDQLAAQAITTQKELFDELRANNPVYPGVGTDHRDLVEYLEGLGVGGLHIVQGSEISGDKNRFWYRGVRDMTNPLGDSERNKVGDDWKTGNRYGFIADTVPEDEEEPMDQGGGGGDDESDDGMDQGRGRSPPPPPPPRPARRKRKAPPPRHYETRSRTSRTRSGRAYRSTLVGCDVGFFSIRERETEDVYVPTEGSCFFDCLRYAGLRGSINGRFTLEDRHGYITIADALEYDSTLETVGCDLILPDHLYDEFELTSEHPKAILFAHSVDDGRTRHLNKVYLVGSDNVGANTLYTHAVVWKRFPIKVGEVQDVLNRGFYDMTAPSRFITEYMQPVEIDSYEPETNYTTDRSVEAHVFKCRRFLVECEDTDLLVTPAPRYRHSSTTLRMPKRQFHRFLEVLHANANYTMDTVTFLVEDASRAIEWSDTSDATKTVVTRHENPCIGVYAAKSFTRTYNMARKTDDHVHAKTTYASSREECAIPEVIDWPDATESTREPIDVPRVNAKFDESGEPWDSVADALSGRSRTNLVVVHGKPGTGKTYALQKMTEQLRAQMIFEEYCVVVCAAMGSMVRRLNRDSRDTDAETFHKSFGIRPRAEKGTLPFDMRKMNDKLPPMAVIMDEATAMGHEAYHWFKAYCAHFNVNPDSVTLVCFCDPLQPWKLGCNRSFVCQAILERSDTCKFHELTVNRRTSCQRDNELMDRIRANNGVPASVDDIPRCSVQDPSDTSSSYGMHVVGTNTHKDEINAVRGPEDWTTNASETTWCARIKFNSTTRAFGVNATTYARYRERGTENLVDNRVSFVVNLYMREDSIINNGELGTVKNVSQRTATVNVDGTDMKVNAEPFYNHEDGWSSTDPDREVIYMFPFELTRAFTAHKIQGLEFEEDLYIHFDKRYNGRDYFVANHGGVGNVLFSRLRDPDIHRSSNILVLEDGMTSDYVLSTLPGYNDCQRRLDELLRGVINIADFAEHHMTLRETNPKALAAEIARELASYRRPTGKSPRMCIFKELPLDWKSDRKMLLNEFAIDPHYESGPTMWFKLLGYFFPSDKKLLTCMGTHREIVAAHQCKVGQVYMQHDLPDERTFVKVDVRGRYISCAIALAREHKLPFRPTETPNFSERWIGQSAPVYYRLVEQFARTNPWWSKRVHYMKMAVGPPNPTWPFSPPYAVGEKEHVWIRSLDDLDTLESVFPGIELQPVEVIVLDCSDDRVHTHPESMGGDTLADALTQYAQSMYNDADPKKKKLLKNSFVSLIGSTCSNPKNSGKEVAVIVGGETEANAYVKNNPTKRPRKLRDKLEGASANHVLVEQTSNYLVNQFSQVEKVLMTADAKDATMSKDKERTLRRVGTRNSFIAGAIMMESYYRTCEKFLQLGGTRNVRAIKTDSFVVAVNDYTYQALCTGPGNSCTHEVRSFMRKWGQDGAQIPKEDKHFYQQLADADTYTLKGFDETGTKQSATFAYGKNPKVISELSDTSESHSTVRARNKCEHHHQKCDITVPPLNATDAKKFWERTALEHPNHTVISCYATPCHCTDTGFAFVLANDREKRVIGVPLKGGLAFRVYASEENDPILAECDVICYEGCKRLNLENIVKPSSFDEFGNYRGGENWVHVYLVTFHGIKSAANIRRILVAKHGPRTVKKKTNLASNRGVTRDNDLMIQTYSVPVCATSYMGEWKFAGPSGSALLDVAVFDIENESKGKIGTTSYECTNLLCVVVAYLMPRNRRVCVSAHVHHPDERNPEPFTADERLRKVCATLGREGHTFVHRTLNYPTLYDLLVGLAAEVRGRRPDVLVGHNSYAYDLLVLKRYYETINLELSTSWSWIPGCDTEENSNADAPKGWMKTNDYDAVTVAHSQYAVPGMSHVDTLWAIEEVAHVNQCQLKAKSLAYLSRQLLGKSTEIKFGKTLPEEWFKVEFHFGGNWKDDPEYRRKMIDYCAWDVLTTALIYTNYVERLNYAMSGISAVNPSGVCHRTTYLVWNAFVKRHEGKKTVPVDRSAYDNEGLYVMGGLVLCPKNRVVEENVVVWDYSGQYPHTIDANDLDAVNCFRIPDCYLMTLSHPNVWDHLTCMTGIPPSTVTGKRKAIFDHLLKSTHLKMTPNMTLDECVESNHGIFLDGFDTVFPSMNREFMDRRAKYKSAMKKCTVPEHWSEFNTMQLTFKRLSNSSYGMTNTRGGGSQLHSQGVAQAITQTSRRDIVKCKEYFTEHGCRVVYGDTDSIFVAVDDGATLPGVPKLSEALKDKGVVWWGNRVLEEMKSTGSIRKGTVLEVDDIPFFSRILLVTKKCYFGRQPALIREDGKTTEARDKIRGLCIVRSDSVNVKVLITKTACEYRLNNPHKTAGEFIRSFLHDYPNMMLENPICGKAFGVPGKTTEECIYVTSRKIGEGAPTMDVKRAWGIFEYTVRAFHEKVEAGKKYKAIRVGVERGHLNGNWICYDLFKHAVDVSPRVGAKMDWKVVINQRCLLLDLLAVAFRLWPPFEHDAFNEWMTWCNFTNSPVVCHPYARELPTVGDPLMTSTCRAAKFSWKEMLEGRGNVNATPYTLKQPCYFRCSDDGLWFAKPKRDYPKKSSVENFRKNVRQVMENPPDLFVKGTCNYTALKEYPREAHKEFQKAATKVLHWEVDDEPMFETELRYSTKHPGKTTLVTDANRTTSVIDITPPWTPAVIRHFSERL